MTKPASPTTWLWDELARVVPEAQYRLLREGYLTQAKLYNAYRRDYPMPRSKLATSREAKEARRCN